MKQIEYEMIKHTEVFIKETMSRVYFKVLLGVGEIEETKLAKCWYQLKLSGRYIMLFLMLFSTFVHV